MDKKEEAAQPQERLFIAPERVVRAAINCLETNPSQNLPVREVMAVIQSLYNLQVATVKTEEPSAEAPAEVPE